MNEQLIERIASAFGDIPYLGDGNIAAETYDDEGTTEHFRGTRWQDHTVESLQNFTVLSFFTPEAFCYYLPAYMLAALQQPYSGIADSLIEFLCPPKNNPKRSSYWAWWSKLSTNQRQCVVSFINEFKPTDPIRFSPVIETLSTHVEV